jgi:tRNA pseudouridine55 synthase
VLPARHVVVHEATLVGVREGERLVWDCSFHVSKGTYIRSIARDLGRSMGTAAHLCALRRTASGPIGLDACVTLEELEATGASDVMAHAIDPAAALGLSTHELTDYERDAAAVGRRFGCRQVVDANGGERQPHEGEHICLVRDGLLRGVWELRDGHMACVSNFPEGIGGVVR